MSRIARRTTSGSSMPDSISVQNASRSSASRRLKNLSQAMAEEFPASVGVTERPRVLACRGMSTQTIESRSPQDQSEVVVSAPAADREAVAAAFKRAREAQKEWKRNAVARADALSAAAAAL